MDQGSSNVYCDCEPVLEAEYDFGSDGTPTEVIAKALAGAVGVDPLDLPPLYEFVELDALDNFFGKQDSARHTGALLSFQVESWNVFVRADGRIQVCDSTRPTEPEALFGSSLV